VELSLGKEVLVADVELTMLAAMEFDFQLDAEKKPIPERNRLAHRAVEEFVRCRLQEGWDPKSNVRLVLNADAVDEVARRMT
jgi:hypothetical protein